MKQNQDYQIHYIYPLQSRRLTGSTKIPQGAPLCSCFSCKTCISEASCSSECRKTRHKPSKPTDKPNQHQQTKPTKQQTKPKPTNKPTQTKPKHFKLQSKGHLQPDPQASLKASCLIFRGCDQGAPGSNLSRGAFQRETPFGPIWPWIKKRRGTAEFGEPFSILPKRFGVAWIGLQAYHSPLNFKALRFNLDKLA